MVCAGTAGRKAGLPSRPCSVGLVYQRRAARWLKGGGGGRGGQLPGWQTGACTPSPGTASGAARGPVQLTTDPAADTSDLYGASPGSWPSLWGVGQGPRVGQALPFYGHQRTCWTTVSGEQGVERTKPQNCRRKKINLFLTCVQTGVCTKK